jgi:hypothetical protein
MQPTTGNVIATGGEPIAVSDQARSELGGALPAQFGAHGTDGTPPPATATSYPSESQLIAQAQNMLGQAPQQAVALPALLTPQPIQDVLPPSPVVTAPQPVMPAPAQQAAPAPAAPMTSTQSMKQPIMPPRGHPTSAPANAGLEAKVDSLAESVANLATIVSAVASKQSGTLPPVPGGNIPVNGTNTGNQSAPMGIGVGAPFAPQPTQTAQGVPTAPPKGPVIPEPSTTPVAGVGSYVETEEDRQLDDHSWIEKHFRYRDLSIDQMAAALRWDSSEVIKVLKEKGYQFPEGA